MGEPMQTDRDAVVLTSSSTAARRTPYSRRWVWNRNRRQSALFREQKPEAGLSRWSGRDGPANPSTKRYATQNPVRTGVFSLKTANFLDKHGIMLYACTCAECFAQKFRRFAPCKSGDTLIKSVWRKESIMVFYTNQTMKSFKGAH